MTHEPIAAPSDATLRTRTFAQLGAILLAEIGTTVFDLGEMNGLLVEIEAGHVVTTMRAHDDATWEAGPELCRLGEALAASPHTIEAIVATVSQAVLPLHENVCDAAHGNSPPVEPALLRDWQVHLLALPARFADMRRLDRRALTLLGMVGWIAQLLPQLAHNQSAFKYRLALAGALAETQRGAAWGAVDRVVAVLGEAVPQAAWPETKGKQYQEA